MIPKIKSPEDFLDLRNEEFRNKDILITGSTSGIGKKLATSLGKKGSNLYLHGRDSSKGKKLVKNIRKNLGTSAKFYRADFSNLNETRSLIDQVSEETDSLDYLINNAGCYYRGNKKAAGYEYTFIVNHISPFILTMKSIPLLRKGDNKKVVVTASEAHRMIDSINYRELEATDNNWRSYCRSKLFNIMISQILDQRINNITVNSVAPGAIPSSGLYRNLPLFLGKLGNIVEYVPLPSVSTKSEGTAMILLGMISDSETPGTYYSDFKVDRASKTAENVDEQKELLRISENISNIDIEDYIN